MVKFMSLEGPLLNPGGERNSFLDKARLNRLGLTMLLKQRQPVQQEKLRTHLRVEFLDNSQSRLLLEHFKNAVVSLNPLEKGISVGQKVKRGGAWVTIGLGAAEVLLVPVSLPPVVMDTSYQAKAVEYATIDSAVPLVRDEKAEVYRQQEMAAEFFEKIAKRPLSLAAGVVAESDSSDISGRKIELASRGAASTRIVTLLAQPDEVIERCEQYRDLVTEYFPADLVDIMIYTMSLESICRADAVSATGDRGLLQINIVNLSKVRDGKISNLYIPRYNIEAAAKVGQEQGLQAWSVIRKGLVMVPQEIRDKYWLGW